MEGDKRIDALMIPVYAAIKRNVKNRDAVTDIYNRAYEALMNSMDALDVSAAVTAKQIAENAKNLQRAEKAEAERDAALSRLSDLENGRPMETAPRDGAHILVEFKDQFGTYFDVIEWPGSYDKWVSDMPDTYDEDVLRWWPLPGRQE